MTLGKEAKNALNDLNSFRDFSWLDVRAMLSEIKSYLINSKVDKVYEINREVLQLRFHNPVHKKINLIIQLPKFFFITKKEFEKPTQPSGFVMLLRKKLQNSRLLSIEQVQSERLLKLVFSKEENFVMYIEFLKPGNIILCDEQDVIIAAYRNLEFSSRKIFPKEKYVFPFKENLICLEKEKFFDVLINSKKQNIVKALALDLALGGFYSELILSIPNIDKSKKAAELDNKELTAIYELFQTLVTASGEEKNKESYLFGKDYSPIFFDKQREIIAKNKQAVKLFPTFSDLVAYLFENSKLVKEQSSGTSKKSEKIKRIIDSQLKELERAKKDYELAKSQGEAIYQNYAVLEQIISEIKTLRKKNYDYEQIQNLLLEKGYKIKINPEENKLIIEL